MTIDTRDFRQALGQFATGVTVITSRDESGSPVGVTASSFNSVSIDPPLVLWSLGKNALSMDTFKTSGYFCVHVLSAAQVELSNRFASRGVDKFAGVEWTEGLGKLPLLPEYAARFQCKTTYQYEGGDHIIFVGEVLEYERTEERPLVFQGGQYALAKSSGGGEDPGAAVDVTLGTFSNNFFLYLLSRAHYQASYQLKQELAMLDLGMSEYLTLTLIGLAGPLVLQELHVRLEHTGHSPSADVVFAMMGRGLLTETLDGTTLSLTTKGRALYVQLLSMSKAMEEQLLDGFSGAEVAEVRDFLKRFINKSNPGVPDLWPGEE